MKTIEDLKKILKGFNIPDWLKDNILYQYQSWIDSGMAISPNFDFNETGYENVRTYYRFEIWDFSEESSEKFQRSSYSFYELQ